MGKFEVTRDQFDAFVNNSGHDAGSKCWTYENKEVKERTGRSFRNPGYKQGGNEPVVCIDWNDAKAYVAWLSKKTGKTYRLLSEAEWEYVARAGTTTRFSFGYNEADLCRHGNGADRTAKKTYKNLTVANCTDNYLHTTPVGVFAANRFGLHDMHGNVWEWVEDCRHGSYNGAPRDGSAWTSGGNCARRVLRGGSWGGRPRNLRSAYRDGDGTDYRNSINGLRVARTL